METNPLNISQELFSQLDINLEDVPLEYLADYTAIAYFLTIEDAPPIGTPNLEKVRRYLESFHHLCQIKDWNRALKVLVIEPDSRIDEELHSILGIWGYHPQQAEIYEDLLYKISSQCDTTCLNGLGNIYDTQGNYNLAREYHTKHLELAQEIGDTSGQWLALAGLGNVQKALGNYQESINYFERALVITRDIKELRGEVIILGSLGSAYNSLNNSSQSKKYAKKCCKLAQKYQFPLFEARAAIVLGNIHKDDMELEIALNWYHHALRIGQELDDKAVIIDVLRGIGDVYESLEDAPSALEWLHKSLKIAQEFGDRAIEAETWRGLGNAYATMGNLEQAIIYLEKRLNFLELTEDKASIANNLQGLSLAYDQLGQLSEAIKYEEKALKILIELEYWQKMADSHAYLGYAHLNSQNYYDALDNLTAALALQRNLEDKRGEAHSLYNLAELMAHLDQISPALKLCQEGLAVAQRYDLELLDAFQELQGLIEAYSQQLMAEESY